ncbi:hypothetical protein IJG14_07245 [bacterium]|nr:hypothetical protein [bacterium]
MKKKILFAMIFTTLLFSNLTSEAVLLPHNMQVYMFTNAIGASIRFDGLINLPDGNIYIPVIPAIEKNVDKLEITYTYPSGKSLNDRPDIICFNNNYSLLRVIPDGKKKTVTSYDNLPEIVKTGVFPQDMLVPTGFYISENLRGLLGNLEIPVNVTSIEKKYLKKEIKQIVQKNNQNITNENSTIVNKNGKKIVKTHKKVLKTKMPQELNNKMYLVTNFDSQYLKVFIPGRPEPIYGLKLKGVLKDAKITPDNKYLITAVFGKNQVDIADLSNEQIAKSLELDMQASEIEIDKDTNKAYILSSEGKSIFIVNLQEMQITEKVKVSAVPYRMVLSPDGTQLAYADKNTDKIFILKIDDEYKNVPITTGQNISKIIIDNYNRLYAISRTNNSLIVNDYNLDKPYIVGDEDEDKGVLLQKKLASDTRKMLGVIDFMPQNAESSDKQEIEPVNATVEEKIIKTGNKPTEMFLYGDKLFIVCSGDNIIDILDTKTLKYIDKIDIPYKGFPKKITQIDNTNLAIVTDTNAKKYAIINLDTNKMVGTYSLDIPVNSIIVIDKINNINLIEQTL